MNPRNTVLVLSVAATLILSTGYAWAGKPPKPDPLEGRVVALETAVGDLQALVAVLLDRLAAVEANTALQLDGHVSVVPDPLNGMPGPQVILEGVNVHIRNETRTTEGTVDGLGNLIIGYNEEPGFDGNVLQPGDRDGSHNLVIGYGNRYSSYAGLVHGWENAVHGEHSAALAGDTNTVVGTYSAIVGGYDSFIDWGPDSVIIGGHTNLVNTPEAVVVGGDNNSAFGRLSVITGGQLNITSGALSSVGGGFQVSTPNHLDWAAGTLYEPGPLP